MNSDRRIIALGLALVLVEVASYHKLSTWLMWTNETWLAYTQALALIALLLASIVALGSAIDTSLRRQFYLGGVWLFTVQALSNVLIAFQYGTTAMPVDIVTRFFGWDPEFALKVMAVVQGATLSAVSLTFWNAQGVMLRTRREERLRRRERLQRLEQILEEDHHEPLRSAVGR